MWYVSCRLVNWCLFDINAHVERYCAVQRLGSVLAILIYKEECCHTSVFKRSVCKLHGLRWRKGGK